VTLEGMIFPEGTRNEGQSSTAPKKKTASCEGNSGWLGFLWLLWPVWPRNRRVEEHLQMIKESLVLEAHQK